jgi:threonine aldolase
MPRSFSSDNAATVHPEVLEYLARVNVGHATAYGYDEWTQRMVGVFQQHFGEDCLPFPVFNGTGANVLAVKATCKPWNSVMCTDVAHLYADECGAPEQIAGVKLVPIVAPQAKLTPELIAPYLRGTGQEHQVQPRLVSITNSTEYGTVYTVAEVHALAEIVHKHGLLLHMDGARISNAVASLGCTFRELTVDAGVDLLSFGGTKNGLLAGEALVFFNLGLIQDFLFIRKQNLQLMSKMRYAAAQFLALLEGDLWHRLASHANAMAQLLYQGVKDIPEITVTQPVQANGVFAILPGHVREAVRNDFFFYDWDAAVGEVRWMCSWDTTAEDVKAFVARLKVLTGAA